jgi:hypothetical protein
MSLKGPDEIVVKIDSIPPPKTRVANPQEREPRGLAIAIVLTFLAVTLIAILYVALGTFDQQKVAAIKEFMQPLTYIVAGIAGFYWGKNSRR